MKSKYYIIGDPVIRAKIHEEEIRDWLQFAFKCTVYAFSFIGVASVLAQVFQICAW